VNPDTWTAADSAAIVAVAAIVQLVVVAVAAAAAWSAVAESRELRKAEHRPTVLIDFAVRKIPRVELVVANSGTLAAHDVTFEFSPTIARPAERPGDPPLETLPIFTRGVSTLPPGKQYRYYFGNYNAMHEHPPSFDVRVRYRAGLKRDDDYDERSTIDVGHFAHTLVPNLDE
jgi:hypothetical protein